MNLICPDCKSRLAKQIKCPSCGWSASSISENVISLLPSILSKEKFSENLIHTEDKRKDILWRDILYKKKFYIERLLNHWGKNFLDDSKKSFLEIAGGYCYISCVIKSLRPDITVWASDVSPSYLESKSSRLAPFFGVKIDQYAAIDAENLPFEDESFDIIFIAHSIHHIGNTEQFFKEANRVLTKNGIFYGVDIAAPRLDYFYQKDIARRSMVGEPLGIHERCIRLSEYIDDLENAGIRNYAITHEKNKPYKNIIDLKLKNYFRSATISITFRKNKT
jgi:ubiquinone/menaquinone biosynthesis C-methylase UbiE